MVSVIVPPASDAPLEIKLDSGREIASDLPFWSTRLYYGPRPMRLSLVFLKATVGTTNSSGNSMNPTHSII
jgi:hypothetical protein